MEQNRQKGACARESRRRETRWEAEKVAVNCSIAEKCRVSSESGSLRGEALSDGFGSSH